MRSVDTHKVRVVLKESLPFVMVTEQFSKTVADEAKCMEVHAQFGHSQSAGGDEEESLF